MSYDDIRAIGGAFERQDPVSGEWYREEAFALPPDYWRVPTRNVPAAGDSSASTDEE